jgi:hypothetical protein
MGNIIVEETTETILYDAMAALMKASPILADLVNRCGTIEEKRAYKDGVYAPCTKLQIVLGNEAMDRGRARHEKTWKDAGRFFAEKSKNKLT